MAVEIEGKKYYHVFTAGDYPQGNISKEDVAKIAAYYDPVNRHEACFWLGHPSRMLPMSEPEALGWVGSLFAVDGKLYFSPSSVSDELKELYAKGKYKRCSVELGMYKEGDMVFPYLYAIGATNRPAVTPMEALEFTNEEDKATHKFNKESFDGEIKVYSNEIAVFDFLPEDLNKNEFPKQTYTMKNLITFAKAHNIQLTGETEAEVTAAFTAHIVDLENKIKKFEQDNETSAKNRAKAFAENLVKEGKITAAKQSVYEDMAFSNYDSAVEMAKDLKPVPASAKSVVKNFEKAGEAVSGDSNIPEGEEKFYNADGTKMNMRQFSEKVQDDPSFAKQFTDDEVAKIPLAPASHK